MGALDWLTGAAKTGISGGLTSAISGGISDVIGGLFGDDDDYNAEVRQMMLDQMEWQSWQAGIQRKWLNRMSSTAHQREVKDLRKAGLNPILSAKLGGASSPGAPSLSGGTVPAQMMKPSEQESSAAAKQMANLATQKIAAEIDLIKSESEAKRAEAGKAKIESDVTGYRYQERIDENIRQIMTETSRIGSDISLKSEQAEKARLENTFMRNVTMPTGEIDVQKAKYALEVLGMEMKYWRGDYGQPTKNLEMAGKAATAVAVATGSAVAISSVFGDIIGSLWKRIPNASKSVLKSDVANVAKSAPPQLRKRLLDLIGE